MELRTIRRGPSLVPATQFDLEKLLALRNGDKPLRTRITLDRSTKLQRWYWAFVTVVAEAIDMPAKPLHLALKTKAGLVDAIITSQAGVQFVIQSTAKDVMGDDEFRPYVELAKNIVFRDYLSGVHPPDVYRRVDEIMGERR